MSKKMYNFFAIALCATIALSGCQIQTSEHTQAWDNIVSESTIMGDSGVDMSSVDKTYANADIVIVGKASTVSFADYTLSSTLPYSTIDFTCEETLKGTPTESITFSSGGGLVPAKKFFENDPTSKKIGGPKELSQKQIENGFVNVKVTKRPQFKEGSRYVVFLSQSEDGKLYTLGSNYSVLSKDDNGITDFEGKSYASIG